MCDSSVPSSVVSKILLKMGDLKLVSNCLLLKYSGSLSLKEVLIKQFKNQWGRHQTVRSDLLCQGCLGVQNLKNSFKKRAWNWVKGTSGGIQFCHYFPENFRINQIKMFKLDITLYTGYR